MKPYRLFREQMIAKPINEVFQFFADAQNLETLTPPRVNFQILTPLPIEMHTGAIIQYSLKLHGIPVQWTTAITGWKPPFEFVDVQLRGPYVMWHHRHNFEAIGEQTLMTDEIHYSLPFGWLGRLAHTLFVSHDLSTIFEFRRNVVERLMGSASITIPELPTPMR
ncbi:MAG: SRPBCC family protein [Planctomycetia bacterium]|nr:SRPBCC family protein [Planctomycetia bacterium]